MTPEQDADLGRLATSIISSMASTVVVVNGTLLTDGQCVVVRAALAHLANGLRDPDVEERMGAVHEDYRAGLASVMRLVGGR